MFNREIITALFKPAKSDPTLPFNLDDDNTTRLWIMSGLFLMAVFAVLLAAHVFDTRTLDGAPVWVKPIKFSMALGLHFLTLAILVQQINRKYRVGITLTSFGYAAVASMLLEIIYISIQAGRGRQSHFNAETALEASMYGVMGLGAFLLVAVSFVLGIMIWRYGMTNGSPETQKSGSGLSTASSLMTGSGLRTGSILGLIFGSILTLLVAGYMSGGSSHLVGQTGVDSSGLPIIGWSRTAGDLRIAHFFATHLMQILPLIGFCCDRMNLPAKKIVIVSTVGLVSLIALSFALAVRGISMFPV